MGTARRIDTGESCIDSIETFTLKLQNGKTARFSVAHETRVPSDLNRLPAHWQALPSRVGFWNYQSERLAHEIRKADRRLAMHEGKQSLIFRKYLSEHSSDVDPATEAKIKALMDCEGDILNERIKLDTLRHSFGIVEGMRKAIERNFFVTQQLMATHFGNSVKRMAETR